MTYFIFLLVVLNISLLISPYFSLFFGVGMVLGGIFYNLHPKYFIPIVINTIIIGIIIIVSPYKFVKNINKRDVVSIKYTDEFYVEYKDKNKLKIKSFDEIPICKRYQIVNKIYDLKVLGINHYELKKNKIVCYWHLIKNML